MESNDAIYINNLTKKYTIVSNDKEKSVFGKKNSTKEKIVLDNVSLKIKKGEVLGILGRNGSGKSTLLSIIAKIQEANTGTIEYHGKVASVLELGMGFHGDMSGRENIYLKGELYGFSKKEIRERIDDIINFSGINEYIDNPVRTYSSGMASRLAFSILMNVDADILIIDEVLSTGDSAFSIKASQHFKKMSKSGKTILIVSHNLSIIEEVCTRAIIIEKGKIIKDGNAKTVCSEYRNRLYNSIEIIKELAEDGVPEYQYKYAKTLDPEETDEVKKWIKKASDQGYPAAQVEYAELLTKDNYEVNKTEILTLYHLAANKGSNDARLAISALKNDNQFNIERKNTLELFKKIANKTGQFNEYRCAEMLLKTAWNSQDKIDAFMMYKTAADNGHVQAMHQIGVMYRDGVGVDKNTELMKRYFEMAIDQENVNSMIALADIYYNGKILPLDENKAFELYLKAAKRGNSNSMYKIAMMYNIGAGIEKNIEESEKWYERYANSLLYPYKLIISDYLKSGDYETIITPIDELNSLIDSGSTSALYGIYTSLACKNNEESTLANKALKSLVQIAKSGNSDARRKLGSIHFYGIGTEKNPKEAIKWYKMAADAGDSWSKLKLGEIYRDGIVTEKNLTESIEWFKQSALQNNIQALCNLISLYTSGETNDKDVFYFGFNNLKKMADCNSSDAMRKIGNYYYEGNGVPKNYECALYYFEKAAMIGDSWCKYRVSEMYRDGKGTLVDKKKAEYWYNQ